MATATEEMASWLLARTREDLEREDPEYVQVFKKIEELSRAQKYTRMKGKYEATRKKYTIQPKQPWSSLLGSLQDYLTHMDMWKFNDESIKAAESAQGLAYYVRARFVLTKSALESLDHFVKMANRKSVIPGDVARQQRRRIEQALNDAHLARGRNQVAHGAFVYGNNSWADSVEREGLWEVAALTEGANVLPMRLELNKRSFYAREHGKLYKVVRLLGDSVLRDVRAAAEAERAQGSPRPGSISSSQRRTAAFTKETIRERR